MHGRRTPLDSFAVVVAVAVSLMFVGVLLAAGGIALEREEHVLARLVRGLVSRAALLVEKVRLAAVCSFVVALAMLARDRDLRLARLGPLPAVAAGAGVRRAGVRGARGRRSASLAREVRAASLLAFLVPLPLVFLALVPAGAVGHGFYDVISVISFVFPFKAALQALDAAVNGGLALARRRRRAPARPDARCSRVLARFGLRRAL